MTVPSSPPLVSIILACYNSEKYLDEAIRSIQAQTYKNWELIAVDDCSTDRTAGMLAQYAAQDARIRPISRQARGGRPAITKNTGLQQAKGSYIAFLDHDDLYLPTKLERSVGCLQAHPQAVALFHDLLFIDGDGRIGDRYLPRLLNDASAFINPTATPGEYLSSDRFFVFQLLRYAGFHTITTLIAKKRLPSDFNLQFNTDYKVCDDTDLWIRLGMAGCIAYLDSPLAHYRIHGNNITSNELKVKLDIAQLQEFNLAKRTARLTSNETRLLRQRLANALSDLGWAYRSANAGKAAALAYLRALRLEPTPRRLVNFLKSGFPVRN